MKALVKTKPGPGLDLMEVDSIKRGFILKGFLEGESGKHGNTWPPLLKVKKSV